MARTPVIEVVKLTKKFDDAAEVELPALFDISLQVYAGEYIIIFGPSGCGKTTLLNVIAGLTGFSDGDAKIRGKSLRHLTEDQLAIYRREKIGMVFQQFNVIKSMTVLQNVALPQLFSGESNQSRLSRAAKLLRLLGLEKHLDKRPSALSGGQQQRVAIARALSNNPWIIIADEPTGNLDSKSADEVMKLFAILNKRSKRTILMVTHNPDYLRFADRVIYMKDGKIVREARHKHHSDADVEKLPDISNLDKLIEG